MRQTSEHEDLEEAEWVPAFEQAKESDKRDDWEVRSTRERRRRLYYTDDTRSNHAKSPCMRPMSK